MQTLPYKNTPTATFISFIAEQLEEFYTLLKHSDQKTLNHSVCYRMKITIAWSLLFVVTIHGKNALLLL